MQPLHVFVFVLLLTFFSFQQRYASALLPNLVNSCAEFQRVKHTVVEAGAMLGFWR